MEPREFIRKVIELYREARKPRFYHPSIKRGLSRTISGLTEDLLSYFLAVNLTEDYDLFTDHNITFSKGIKTIRPDTVIVKNNVIEHIIDIKTDFGWMRDKITEFCRNKNEELKKIKGKSGKIQILNPDGITKLEKILKISDNLIFHIVVINRENISKEKIDNHLQNVKNLKLENVEVYTLTSEIHPNIYEKPIEEVLNSIKIHEDEFKRLMDNLTS
ncbi:MAG: hypothetical protein KJI71_00210 [Patescibacteria group bacterium]|nr:hypothetical protein [Patescibacteria group bacterium]